MVAREAIAVSAECPVSADLLLLRRTTTECDDSNRAQTEQYQRRWFRHGRRAVIHECEVIEGKRKGAVIDQNLHAGDIACAALKTKERRTANREICDVCRTGQKVDGDIEGQ